MNALNELKKWMIENNDDDTPLHPSDIYKKIDELIASQPSGGKSAEDCLNDNKPYGRNWSDFLLPDQMEFLYRSMEQYAHQQPVQGDNNKK